MSLGRRQFSFRSSIGWWLAFAAAFSMFGLLLVSMAVLFTRGVGVWGINVPVGWGFAITNFVWWIGIGHAGTFISAFLYLMRQEWRTSISRFAETMTIFAVLCAALFPMLHLGRPWFFYWFVPWPNTMTLWPQFRSPLIWDFFAVGTYFTVSLLFWYLGLVPDFAVLRDRAPTRFARIAYGIFALGWRGSSRHWRYYKSAYLLFAGLAAPLVISVHSIVGMDFAYSAVPGWHSTIFPPYFVAGAIFSGFAMVLTLGIPLRSLLRLEDLVTVRHLDLCARFTLVTGMIVAYGYLMETFTAYYTSEPFEMAMIRNRYWYGPYWWCAWIMLFCNVCAPQLLWSSRVRRSPATLFALSLVIQLGMWMERFVIVVTSLMRDFLVSSWRIYVPTIWDWSTLLGSMGLFATGYLLFTRYLPVVAVSELREEEEKKEKGEMKESAA